MAMNLSDALKKLGIYNLYYNKRPSKDELKCMRRNDLIKHHPDKGGNTDTFIEISKAWDRVMKHLAADEERKANQCENCYGTGWTTGKGSLSFVQVTCKKCKGTGQKRKKDKRI